MKATLYITLRDEIPDVAGKAVKERLVESGFGEVREAKIGRLIEVQADSADKDAFAGRIEQMCRRMLVNAEVEEFRVEIED